MKKLVRLPLLLLLALATTAIAYGTLGSEKAYACSCAMFESYTDALESSSHVLDATVVNKKEKSGGKLDVALSVSAVWKGEAEQEMNVVTSASSASCGYEFETGKRYAIFAKEQDDELHVSLCSATSTLADDSAIFDELGQPQMLEYNRGSIDDGGESAEQPAEESPTSPSNDPDAGNQPSDVTDPDQIKKTVSQAELEQRLDTRKSQLMLVFAVVGGLLIAGAAVLLVMRRKR